MQRQTARMCDQYFGEFAGNGEAGDSSLEQGRRVAPSDSSGNFPPGSERLSHDDEQGLSHKGNRVGLHHEQEEPTGVGELPESSRIARAELVSSSTSSPDLDTSPPGEDRRLSSNLPQPRSRVALMNRLLSGSAVTAIHQDEIIG